MNTEFSKIGGIDVEIVRKQIKNLHIGCYPPEGRVRIAAPKDLSAEAIRIAVLTRIQWIRRKQAQFQQQDRQSARRYISGETHFVFGRRLRLEVREWSKKVHRISQVGNDRLRFDIPQGSGTDQRQRWMASWMKAELRKFAAPRLSFWADRLAVQLNQWGIRPMKTKWGSCNAEKGIIWLNLELAKKPERTVDYVIVHELAHLISAKHDERFIAVLDREMPRWRTIRQELNSMPLEAWVD